MFLADLNFSIILILSRFFEVTRLQNARAL